MELAELGECARRSVVAILGILVVDHIAASVSARAGCNGVRWVLEKNCCIFLIKHTKVKSHTAQ